MTRLQRAILDVLDCARGPLTAETILVRQRVTRQISRVRLALEAMEAEKVVSFASKNNGWRRFGVVFQGERTTVAASSVTSQLVWSMQ